MSKASYTVEEILRVLDEHGRNYSFPMLDNDYFYPGDVRLSAYADQTRWAIIIEQLCCNNRQRPREGIETYLGVFGNCVLGPASFRQVGGLTYRTSDDETLYSGRIPPSVTKVEIRGREVFFPRDPKLYKAKRIKIEDPALLHGHELMRVLLPEHREAMLATEEERRRLIPHDLPLFARLDEWHHPDLADDELVSECSTFRNLAIAMVELEPNRFRLTEKPNTHWSNWPMGGTL